MKLTSCQVKMVRGFLFVCFKNLNYEKILKSNNEKYTLVLCAKGLSS